MIMLVLKLLNFLDWFNQTFWKSTLTNFQFVVLCISVFTILFGLSKVIVKSKKRRIKKPRKYKKKNLIKGR